MSFEKDLINLVKKEEPIWDTRIAARGIRKVQKECWKRVSKKLKVEMGICKYKYTYLRRRYIKCVKEMQQGNGSVEWKHFRDLNFLRDHVKPIVQKTPNKVSPGSPKSPASSQNNSRLSFVTLFEKTLEDYPEEFTQELEGKINQLIRNETDKFIKDVIF